ncbi:NUDIX domain-containing protein [Nocardioides sp. AE5]|uniref:NUDIX domain-containing protein n=1 Tax=Nocardioides sp. AE5 TaxID=2962573 RepID=UPI002880EFE3|nr:NUDIX domain-containing protein [Nocardioides sp. AE5]MDT0200764.1 NUDIX domain-containing protein [Nocardioides sp. AE5]
MGRLPKRQRVAAYAVIERGDSILLSRLAPRISRTPLWTLPGGGLDHGEDPRTAVVREVHEETGLDATVSEQARVYSLHNPHATHGERLADYHALRIVFEGWVPVDSPPPRVVEVDGSTSEAAWIPLADVADGTVSVTTLVREALADHTAFQRQRLAAYGLIRRDDTVLLTRISPLGHHAGSWTLPGGGVEHGEPPAQALVREVREECGIECTVGGLLDVHDVHFTGTAPHGRQEDFHGVHLVFAATVAADAEPRVAETDGTTDEVAWVPVADIEAGRIEVLDVVRHALSTQP